MLDNYSVAIMAAVNELADRVGLKPYDFVAVIGVTNSDDADSVLRFEAPPENDKGKSAAFSRMLSLLNMQKSIALSGTEKSIYDALQTALSHTRHRGRSG